VASISRRVFALLAENNANMNRTFQLLRFSVGWSWYCNW